MTTPQASADSLPVGIRPTSFYGGSGDYDVTFSGGLVQTTVTWNHLVVNSWVSKINELFHDDLMGGRGRGRLVVGLGVQWSRLSNSNYERRSLCTVQLATNGHCLVFHCLHCPSFPAVLRDFLANPQVIFAGVNIDFAAAIVQQQLNMALVNAVEVRELFYGARVTATATATATGGLYRSIHEMSRRVLQCFSTQAAVPRYMAASAWGEWSLTDTQIIYSSIFAHITYLLARELIIPPLS